MLLRSASVPFLLLCHGCGSDAPVAAPEAAPVAAREAAPAAAKEPLLRCTLVLLKTGPRTEPLTQQQRQQVFAGHFANMQRLAEERQLLLAGPYGKERQEGLRGIFVLDTDDPRRARELAETDPGVAAGVFALEYHPMATDADLRRMLARELEREAEIAASGGKPKPGDNARSYVLLTVEDGAAAHAALAGHDKVLCFAWLDEKRALSWLDATNAAEARTMLAPLAQRLGEHRVDEWFGTDLLTDLR